MGSSSGESTESAEFQTIEAMPEIEQKKRKRMISNRESARRSRIRKQKHMDDLTAQVKLLREENRRIFTVADLTSRQYMAVEAENIVLRSRVAELTQRLQTLDEITGFINTAASGVEPFSADPFPIVDGFLNPCSSAFPGQSITMPGYMTQY